MSVSDVNTDEDREVGAVQTLPFLMLHVHNTCNCRCLMCDIWKNNVKTSLCVTELERHRESIERLHVKQVVFTGGEPLLNPEIREISSFFGRLGIRRTLLTSGLLLRKRALDIVEGFEEVIVSVDGPPQIHDRIRGVQGAFQLLEEGVRTLSDLSPSTHIGGRCTVQKSNYRLLVETAAYTRDVGLKSLSFLGVDVSSQAFNRLIVWPDARQAEVSLTSEEINELEVQLERIVALSEAPEWGRFIVDSPQKIRRISHLFRARLGLEGPKAPMCNAPWVSAVLELDGTVRPCFFQPPIGETRSTTLDSAVNGERAREFRRDLDVSSNTTCQRCVCSLNHQA